MILQTQRTVDGSLAGGGGGGGPVNTDTLMRSETLLTSLSISTNRALRPCGPKTSTRHLAPIMNVPTGSSLTAFLPIVTII